MIDATCAESRRVLRPNSPARMRRLCGDEAVGGDGRAQPSPSVPLPGPDLHRSAPRHRLDMRRDRTDKTSGGSPSSYRSPLFSDTTVIGLPVIGPLNSSDESCDGYVEVEWVRRKLLNGQPSFVKAERSVVTTMNDKRAKTNHIFNPRTSPGSTPEIFFRGSGLS